MRGSGEGVVERENGSGTFKAVAGEVEFGHCVNWYADR